MKPSEDKEFKHVRASDSLLRARISPAWLAVIINMAITVGSFIWFAATLNANTTSTNNTMTHVVKEIQTLHTADSLIMARGEFNSVRINILCAYIDGHRCPQRDP